MATAVRISDELIAEAQKMSKVEHRSVTGQIEHWAKIGKIAEENSDLPYERIKDILVGIAELENGQKTVYEFG